MQPKIIVGIPGTYGMAPKSGKQAAKNARSKSQIQLIKDREEGLKAAVRAKKALRRKMHKTQEQRSKKS